KRWRYQRATVIWNLEWRIWNAYEFQIPNSEFLIARITGYGFYQGTDKRGSGSEGVLSACGRWARVARVEAREDRRERRRLRRARGSVDLFHLGHVRSELPADRHQAGQRADCRPDLPARLLRLVRAARGRAERPPHRGGAGAD